MTQHPLTFLFTDLENSTPLWEQFPDEMRLASARHDALVRKIIEAHQGRVVKTTGDGFHAVFESPSNGVAAALDGQQAINAESWPVATGQLKVRMGLHTGESQEREGDYYGTEVNRSARIMSLGYGGQVLISGATAALIQKSLPPGCSLTNLGEHRLKGIATPEHIFQLCHPDLPNKYPPLKSLAVYKHNLPNQLSSFIGREKELAEVKCLIKDAQLLTLLGPGGTGKTRLMLQVAEEIIEDYPDGVWLVELAPLNNPNLIAERVATVLNVPEQPGREKMDLLVEFLRRKELLLLLDNVEHLIRESAEFVENLLDFCPKLTILVTGREPLFIDGETTIQIPSLSLPEKNQTLKKIAQSEGVQLFLERAHQVSTDFELSAQNAVAVAEIVRRLDGIPLALELAAARLRMMSVEQIADRLNDRFRLLTGGRRTALPRQQTLQALIDWSWNLLNEQERMLLRRLSVFFGGWTLEAAQAVTSDQQLDEFEVLNLFDQLISKSLVNVKHLPQGEVRYNMLESIHQYARDRLIEAGEWERLRDQHAEYYTEFGERVSQELQGQEMLIWIGRLLRETDNAKATREWTLDKRLDLALRIAGASMLITRYWFYSSDDIHWLEQVVKRAKAHPEAETNPEIRQGLAKAVIALGAITTLAGDFENGRQIIEEGIDLAKEVGVVEQRIFGLNMLLITFFQMGELRTAEGVAEKSLTLSEEHSLNFWHLMAIGYLVSIFVLQDKNEQADYYAEQAIRLAKKLNNPWLTAMTSFQLARLEEQRKNWEQAEKYVEKAADLFESVRDYGMALTARSELGHMKRMQGDVDGAERVYQQTVITFQERGHSPAVAHQLECFGMIAVRKNQDARAARLFGAANTIRQTVHVNRLPSEQIEFDQILAQLAETMGEIERDRVMAEGAKLSLDEAVELALAGV